MLINVSLKNFRSVKELQNISLEAVNDRFQDSSRKYELNEKLNILNTVAIIGANGVGKSSIVRALEAVKSIVCANLEEENPLKSLLGNQFAYGSSKIEPSEITLTFTVGGVITYYTLVADVKRIYFESLYQKVDKYKCKLFTRKYNSETNKDKVFFGRLYNGEKRKARAKLKPNKSFLNVSALVSQDDTGNDIVLKVYGWFKNVLDIKPAGFSQGSENYLAEMLTRNPSWGAKIVKFLWACDITDVKEITVQNGHPIFIHSNVSNKYGSYFSGESLSLRRLTTIMASMFEAYEKEKVMIFDDFSIMLHPNVVEFLVKEFEIAANVGQSQLFVVDCNPVFIKKGLLRKDGVYFAEKNSDGSTRYYSLSDFSGSLSKQDYEISYRNGMFGALPLISDFRFDK